MKKDNIEAIKSSVLAGLANGLLFSGIGLINNSPDWHLCGYIGFLSGVVVGLLTTWDLGE